MNATRSQMAALALAGLCPGALADELFSRIDSAPRSEFWIDTGFATAHFNNNRGLNSRNMGVGAEYRFAGTMAATAGRFHNSDREWSNYAGVLWQPLAIGPVRLGAALAMVDGYPNMRDGGWFPAVIPTFTFDYERVGINIGVIPSYKDRLYGGITFQLKFKLSE